MVQVIIPWFPAALKANSRKQHRYSTETRKKYKFDCCLLAQLERADFGDVNNIALDIKFCPPTGHSRDLDNCLASIKYGLDGIADAWGVNDACFHPITIQWGEIVKGGSIIIKARGVV